VAASNAQSMRPGTLAGKLAASFTISLDLQLYDVFTVEWAGL